MYTYPLHFRVSCMYKEYIQCTFVHFLHVPIYGAELTYTFNFHHACKLY